MSTNESESTELKPELTVQRDWDAMEGFTDEAKALAMFELALQLEGDLNEVISAGAGGFYEAVCRIVPQVECQSRLATIQQRFGESATAYLLQHEVNRVLIALQATGADMTVRSALHEAYQAGRNGQSIDLSYSPLSNDEIVDRNEKQ